MMLGEKVGNRAESSVIGGYWGFTDALILLLCPFGQVRSHLRLGHSGSNWQNFLTEIGAVEAVASFRSDELLAWRAKGISAQAVQLH